MKPKQISVITSMPGPLFGGEAERGNGEGKRETGGERG